MTQDKPKPSSGADKTINDMVDRFLIWPLPRDFSPDGEISFTKSNNPNFWPSGTNLFTAAQAKSMVEHLLGDRLRKLELIERKAKMVFSAWENEENITDGTFIELLDELGEALSSELRDKT